MKSRRYNIFQTMTSQTLRMKLKRAIESNDLVALDSIIKEGGLDLDLNATLPGCASLLPLHLAAVAAKATMVERLLDAGADINAPEGGVLTALCHAAHVGNLDVARLLIDRGADFVVSNPLRQAITGYGADSEQVVMMLIDAGAPYDEFMLCFAAAKSTSMVQLLIKRNVDVRQLRSYGCRTPCHVACFTPSDHDVDLLNMLVNDVGIDVNLRDANGDNCSVNCARHGNADLLHWLIDAGCEIQPNTLRTACSVWQFDCVVLLIACGLDVHAKDKDGKTAFQLAIESKAHSGKPERSMIALMTLFIDLKTLEGAEWLLSLAPPTDRELAAVRHALGSAQLDLFARKPAFQMCLGLQSLELPALLTCEILHAAFGATMPERVQFILFHDWWNFVTTIKHFKNGELCVV